MRNPLTRLLFARDHRWSQTHMSDYIDADASRSESRRIERHAGDCPECRALLASLQAMVVALASLSGRPTESVADGVLAGVHERLIADDDTA